MFAHSRLFPCLLVLAWAGAPDAASAQDPVWGTIGLAAPRVTDADVSHAAGLSMSLDQAMDVARKHHPGRVVEAGLDRKDQRDRYTVLLASGDGLHRIWIDPANGDVTGGDAPDIARSQLTAAGQRDLQTLLAAPVDLPQAVAAAEARGHGKAISAGVEQIQGASQYYIQTVANQKLADWVVDPKTGSVAAPY